MSDIALWYLAHPVTQDRKFTMDENLEHTLKMVRLCHEAGFYAVAPWYAMVQAYTEYRDTKAYERFREMGLSMDEENVRAYGRIILTGHTMSSGMKRELSALGGNTPIYNIINIIGLRDDDVVPFLVEHKKYLINAGFLQA